MTPWLAQMALFACGVYVGLRLVAAAYRPRDLWYTIGTAWPLALRGIVGWAAAAAVPAALLEGRWRASFLRGMLAFLLFHAALYVLFRLALRKPRGQG